MAASCDCKPHLFVGYPPACTRCGEYDRERISHTEEVESLRARVAELERALQESKLDVGQVTAERDNLRYSNRLLRERRDELEADNREWQEKYRGERRLREEQRDLVEAAERRVAELERVRGVQDLEHAELMKQRDAAEQRVAELERLLKAADADRDLKAKVIASLDQRAAELEREVAAANTRGYHAGLAEERKREAVAIAEMKRCQRDNERLNAEKDELSREAQLINEMHDRAVAHAENLQAEVERLNGVIRRQSAELSAWSTRATDAECALAESERKRAELAKAFADTCSL